MNTLQLLFTAVSLTGRTPCKYGPVFTLYLYRIESNRVNTVQKRVRIYTAFFLCLSIVAKTTPCLLIANYHVIMISPCGSYFTTVTKISSMYIPTVHVLIYEITVNIAV